MRKFMELFQFDPLKALFVGVERECFLTNSQGAIVPIAAQVLSRLSQYNGRFGYELSACQLEERVGPCRLAELHDHLIANDQILKTLERELGFSRIHSEVGPNDMPLDIYPDPSGRYQKITQNMPKPVLLAACQIIGTHVHIGMPDHDTALRVYNQVVSQCDFLCKNGSSSNGLRLSIYRTVAPYCDPKQFTDWCEFFKTAFTNGFDKNPRNCWNLIRISVHGTIEFRMFGASPSLEKVVAWASLCHGLCATAMA